MSKENWPEGTQELLEVIKEILWTGEQVEVHVPEPWMRNINLQLSGKAYGEDYVVNVPASFGFIGSYCRGGLTQRIRKMIQNQILEELANYREVQE